MATNKRYEKLVKSYDRKQVFDYKSAVELVKKNATAKFDESFEVSMYLGVDPRKADQLVRGTVALPHGTGKTVRVLVVAKTPKDKEALDAGADHAGFTEYLEKLQGGWADIDIIIATPDVMGELGKLGRILGPRGLMPNPKSGTVTFDVAKAVAEVKAGKIEFRVDKAGNVHASIGRCSFSPEKLAENAQMFVSTILRAKPATAKGKYVKSLHFSSTMGPSVRVDENSIGADH
ncbi:MAG: 50S ribosomal protein L1 [Chlorobi bacterium]|nr:MAG: 50S ribosomal protein L1 [Bacteroidota bacterium]KXK35809.1 MAG: 50S ribosomal protein L1 [Chlorobi bacterium OLB6]MBE2265354.1 50S ribosomal protein L1 [Flavobacteriales bacterium]MBL1160307.1 50S ribosomal protein L1 [Chlorobiota bacterium]MBW7853446.1 50S ribosomal protein L1 [Candidatus Kapabacteria bacterium]MCC6330492.1 50S ribosomal protein L1 [Ignavibacteria bacterium]